MINNYKAQKIVQAEAQGAININHPVALYPEEDQIIYGNTIFSDNFSDIPLSTSWTKAVTQYNWTANGDGMDHGGTVAMDADGSVKITIPGSGETSHYVAFYQDFGSDIPYKKGQQYEVRFKAKGSQALTMRTTTDNTTANCPMYHGQHSVKTLTTEWVEYRTQWTVSNPIAGEQDRIQVARDTTDGDGWYFQIKDIQIVEVLDFNYKLMAYMDSVPSHKVSTDSGVLGPEMGDDPTLATSSEWGVEESPDGGNHNWIFPLPSASYGCYVSTGYTSKSIFMHPDNNPFSISPNHKWRLTLTYRRGFLNSSTVKVKVGSTVTTLFSGIGIDTSNQVLTHDFETSESAARLELYVTVNGAGHYSIYNWSVQRLHGYDSYSVGQGRWGVVTDIYDKDTGAMKAAAVAGDRVDVCLQGECDIKRLSGTYNIPKEKLVTRIESNGAVSNDSYTTNDGAALPNSLGVIPTATTGSETTQPVILWQGVDSLNQGFSYKDSYQVHAKCKEAVSKFRAVSLFLDGNGDLLCIHDNIGVDNSYSGNADIIDCNPYKWGVSEEGGGTGDTILVTVAGRTTWDYTHVSDDKAYQGYLLSQLKSSTGGLWVTQPGATSVLPNGHATVLEDFSAAKGYLDISLFKGVPTGPINNHKRTIKITAQYGDEFDTPGGSSLLKGQPVSLFLDSSCNYRCVKDDIPVIATDNHNAHGVDLKKWGIANNDATYGDFVEVTVAGRAEVLDTFTNAHKGKVIHQIKQSDGYTTGINNIAYNQTAIGIVEKSTKHSDSSAYGRVIIY